MGSLDPVASCARCFEKRGVPNYLATNAGSELAPYKELATGFFGSLAGQSAFSKIYNAGDFTRTPLRTLISVLATAPVGYAVSELAPKNITSMDFSTATLEAEKVSAVCVISDELGTKRFRCRCFQIGRRATPCRFRSG